MANLLKLFNEYYNEENSLSNEEKAEGNQIISDLKKIIRTFKKIRTELEIQNPQDVVLIDRVNAGIAETESLLNSMQLSLELDQVPQAVTNISRP